MNFIFIPIYVHYLGIESYGIIGFYATMLAAMTLFDFGLISLAVKEIAVVKYKARCGRTLPSMWSELLSA